MIKDEFKGIKLFSFNVLSVSSNECNENNRKLLLRSQWINSYSIRNISYRLKCISVQSSCKKLGHHWRVH